MSENANASKPADEASPCCGCRRCAAIRERDELRDQLRAVLAGRDELVDALEAALRDAAGARELAALRSTERDEALSLAFERGRGQARALAERGECRKELREARRELELAGEHIGRLQEDLELAIRRRDELATEWAAMREDLELARGEAARLASERERLRRTIAGALTNG